MRRRTIAVSALVVGAAFVPVGAAAAADDPEAFPVETDEFIDVPEDSDFYDAFEVPGCGSTLTFEGGDVRELEYRYTVLDDGSDRLSFRGDATVDITRESDGAEVDELDASGPGFSETSADGTAQTNGFFAPGFFYSTDQADREAYAAAGLPEVFYYTEGYFQESIVYAEDSDAVVAAVVEVNEVKDAVDVCELLDEAADDD